MYERNLFRGELQKFRLISNNICYGPQPEPDDEIEQRLTINADGRVWFSAYRFGGDDDRSLLSRQKVFSIERAVAQRILTMLSINFGSDYMIFDATDIGTWDLELTNTDGEVFEYHGSLFAEIVVDQVDVSDLIRDSLNMDDLYVFDGNDKPDRVERLTVDYRRITKTKPSLPLSNEIEYITWDYSETLVLDRKTETLEHIQNVGSGCIVTRKYYVQGGVQSLLDSIDPDDLFGEIAGPPADIIPNPMETTEYKVTVDFKKGSQQVLSGAYDKYGVPEYWDDFIEEIWSFIQFYGFGEIMDSSIYRKAPRHKGEIIYCSVEFDQWSKSYYYIADEDIYRVGDRVVVPTGPDNHHSIARIAKVEYFSEADVPLPVVKTKHIVRKCEDEFIDPPNT